MIINMGSESGSAVAASAAAPSMTVPAELSLLQSEGDVMLTVGAIDEVPVVMRSMSWLTMASRHGLAWHG